ncbi:conserved hypothetical protein [Leishmania major strain Friedlin]|uniref:Uncharacterized protein n=1 Tax=Leishmania major TaxID=5664 RepID=E9ADE2_LEIMA|nr:conserved hypothetical protein [Leishmania major strain Friedlin]CAG9576770.1 IC140_flagellar_axoneme_protein [Leishmania major strain Friedlin]CBZ12230.1 conserved hypothetical protein [Leishmania major strain Friedlin]|eukprot:XP_003721971.1 conserved hypothetical protein [Leishmania major strain Friedlin]
MSATAVPKVLAPHPAKLASDVFVATAATAATTAASAASGSAAAAPAAPIELVTKELLQLAEELRVVVPQGTWMSQGSEKEIRKRSDKDAVGAPAIPSRLPITVHFEVARHAILRHRTSAHKNYVTKEASEDSRDLRSVDNPLYEVMHDEVDTGVQAVPRRTVASTQTHHARRVNAVAQAEPTVVDACIRHLPPPKEEQPNLCAFMEKVLPRTLLCLTQNYQIPIYTDDFRNFTEDDAVIATHDELVLIEKANYVHSSTKGRKVSGVSWRSGRKRDHFVCVASIGLQTLPERLQANRRCESSVSLVWDLSDPMHPRYLLEAPEEVQVLHFHPSEPNLVAGGSLNGQVFLWDLSKADVASFFSSARQHKQKQKSNTAAAAAVDGGGGETGEFREVGEVPRMPDSLKGVSLEADGDVQVPCLQPFQQSRVELSHQGPVHDLQWLPDSLEFGFDGKQTVVKETHQFVTISEDGTMLVWDTRPQYLPQDKLRKIKHQSRSGGGEQPWVPLLRYQLTKPDGTGEMPGFRFFLSGCTVDEAPSYAAAVASADGELGFCSMITQHERRSSIVVPTFGYTKDTRFVRSVVPVAHAGPVYSVQQHPTIGDVYLTCGDGCFKVWRYGLLMPLYECPQRLGSVMCAAWSPARPGLIIIGTGNGMVEVWDLLDRNPEPMLTHHLVQDAITSIAFQPLPHRVTRRYSQQLLLGTNLGSFHWYVLPPALSRASSGERKYMRAMLERETRRVAYYDWRWSERQSEIDRFGLQGAAARLRGTIAQTASSSGVAGVSGKEKSEPDDPLLVERRPDKEAADSRDLDNPYAQDPQRDEEFLEMVEKLHQKELEHMELESAA